jgi:hypothetical protein
MGEEDKKKAPEKVKLQVFLKDYTGNKKPPKGVLKIQILKNGPVLEIPTKTMSQAKSGEFYKELELDQPITLDDGLEVHQVKLAPTDKVYKLYNPYWEMDLSLDFEQQVIILELRNLLSSLQAPNVTFKMRAEEGGTPFDFTVQAAALTAGKSVKVKQKLPDGVKEIVEVKQVLTFETAAVKRIQQVSIGSGKRPGGAVQGQGMGPGMGGGIVPGAPGAVGGASGPGAGSAHSVKTLPKGLAAIFKLKPKAEAAGGAVGGMPMGGMGGMAGVPGMVGGGQATENTTSENGFDMSRYVKIGDTESANLTARRVPVGVVLVIDQDHLARVLTSFSNSKLRFKTEQVIWSRYPKAMNVLKQSYPKGYGPGGMGYPGAFDPAYFDPKFGAGYPPPPGMPGGAGGMGMYGETEMPDGSAEGASAHLELVIYGIVSLYQRFPNRPETEAAPPG